MAGGTVFDPISAPEPSPDRIASPVSLLESLTGQERKVLSEVATGKTDKEVAVALGLSTKTVRNYLDRAFEKLRVNTRTQAALVYLQQVGNDRS